MSHTDDFWAPRPSFVEPIAEYEEAASLLDRAASALLTGDLVLMRDALRQADIPSLHAHVSRVMGETNATIHRLRPAVNIPVVLPKPERASTRNPPPALSLTVFTRDGFRCRYCGCRIVVARARTAFNLAIPGVVPWEGRRDIDRHAAFLALTAVADHVLPHARGGRTDMDNLVTSCQGCNYGKNEFHLDELGLIDPRTRPPIRDAWDGLRRLLPLLAKPARVAREPTKARVARPAERTAADWFRAFEEQCPGQAAKLTAWLEEGKAAGIYWTVNEVLLVKINIGDTVLIPLGIMLDGSVEIPWYIAESKAQFRPVAEAIAAAIPGAIVYETPRMWRVRANGRAVTTNELLESGTEARAAIAALGGRVSEA